MYVYIKQHENNNKNQLKNQDTERERGPTVLACQGHFHINKKQFSVPIIRHPDKTVMVG